MRDRAIGMLLFFTGIRSCDICYMKFSDIDWEKEELHIIQQKTANILFLPMSAAVGNAIYDYVIAEPPSSEGAYLSADVQHLREYTLSISPFPINGEMLPLVDYFNKIYPVMDDSMEHLSRNLMSALIIGLDKDIG